MLIEFFLKNGKLTGADGAPPFLLDFQVEAAKIEKSRSPALKLLAAVDANNTNTILLGVARGDRVGRRRPPRTTGANMFMVENSAVSAIQVAFETSGMPAAIIALRERFNIQDDTAAAQCVERILRWAPVDETATPKTAKPARRRSTRRSPERATSAH